MEKVKPVRYNTVAGRRLKLHIAIKMAQPEIDKLTLGEIKQLKKDMQSNLEKYIRNDMSSSIRSTVGKKISNNVKIDINRVDWW